MKRRQAVKNLKRAYEKDLKEIIYLKYINSIAQ